MSSTARKPAVGQQSAANDGKGDFRPIALARMLILGNPALIYNAQDWNKTPTHRDWCEHVGDTFGGVVFDTAIQYVRKRYRNLDELPTRYGIAFCAAYYLRRCAIRARHDICPGFYFYGYDDRLIFVDIFRGLRQFGNDTKTESHAMERSAASKGFGRTVKSVIRGCYDGRIPQRVYSGQNPNEDGWKQIFEKRNLRQVMIDICSNTCVHGWEHADLIKMVHLPTSSWNHLGQLFTLVAWAGPRQALQKIKDYAPPDFGTEKLACELLNLVRVIDQVKRLEDPAAVAVILEQHPDLCRQIYPPGVVPTRHYMVKDVAVVFATHSPLRQIFRYLQSWNARGFVRIGEPLLDAIVERLKKPEVILEERLSPAEILMAWKNYERYEQRLQRIYGDSTTGCIAELKITNETTSFAQRPPSKKRQRPGQNVSAYEPLKPILDAFSVAFLTSFQNFIPAAGNKKFFIAIDARPSLLQQPVYGAKYLKAAEAISCLLSIAIRKEASAQIQAFSDRGLKPLNFAGNASVDDIAKELNKMSSSDKVPFACAFAKAADTGSNFVVILTDRPSDTWVNEVFDATAVYQSRNNMKIVVWFLDCQRDNAQQLPGSDNVLAVFGWNQFVPEVIWSFARGQLDDGAVDLRSS